MNIKTILAGATALTVAGGTAYADPNTLIFEEGQTNENLTIVENAAGLALFSTLVTAAQAAGLADDLMGEGPFTIFAPSNEAFAALPEGTVENLLMPENQEQLADLLMAHVVPSYLTTNDLRRAELGNEDENQQTEEFEGTARVEEREDGTILISSLAEPYNVAVQEVGGSFYVYSDMEGSTIDEPRGDIRIIGGDVLASNGVIHVIDGVLMPKM
ncbi:MAG: fasciclin domain-containing protein [Shimia sp.]